MRKKLAAVVVALALLATGMVLGSVTTASSGSSSAATRVRAFNPDSKTVDADIDVGEEGEGIGDYFIGFGPLLDKPGGRKIGSIKFQCFALQGDRGRFAILCNAGFWFEDRGKITGGGPIVLNFRGGGDTTILPIAGGTGEFRNASGTVKLLFRRRGVLFIFSLAD